MMPSRELICHPGGHGKMVGGMTVSASRRPNDMLWLLYRVLVNPRVLRLPPVADPVRVDGLWEATCFEAFFRLADDDDYYEFNFAPSLEWAAYSFTGYREGRADLPLSAPPFVSIDSRAGLYIFEVDLKLPSQWSGSALHLGMSAVVETLDGNKSYWALAHPPGDPDFHHPDSFALQLPPTP